MDKILDDPVGTTWFDVIDQLDEAVIVLDASRTLRHVNRAARTLLGYEEGQKVGGRCRLTTRGVDCENACPLTFALETGLDRVEDFNTIYHAVDGHAIHLAITVIPVAGDEGEFKGAVEILRPTDPPVGFFLSGTSESSLEMRRRTEELSRTGDDVQIAGEVPACRDVALALHRFSGLPEELFVEWQGSWDDISVWPPGNIYACGEGAASLLDSPRPDGWRAIIGTRSRESAADTAELLELMTVSELADDLSTIILAWVESVSPGTRVSPDALECLVSLARERGLEPLEEILTSATASAGGLVETEHLPVNGARTALVDELLQAENPLAALESKVLQEVLQRYEWRMQDAADRLGISRVTLWRKLKELGIDRP